MSSKKSLIYFGLLSSLLTLQGCSGGLPEPKNTICEVDSVDASAIQENCKKGERVLFSPEVWGNDQLTVTFSAMYCDPRYSIALSKGAVSCIYQPADLEDFYKRIAPKEEKKE
jgi:hypothetical protein